MSEYRYPTGVMVVRYNGGRVHLKPSQQWDADDPFVKARPELFRSGTTVTHSAGFEPVEQATRAPGEKRAVRRGPKKAEDTTE